MKLALCLEYPIEQPGGTEVLVRELIHGLAARHQIVLVSGDSAESLRASSVTDKIIAHFPWDMTAVTLEKSRALARFVVTPPARAIRVLDSDRPPAMPDAA